MNAPMRIARVIGSAFILAALLSMAGELHRNMEAKAQAGTDWGVNSETTGQQNSDGSSDYSDKTTQHSSDGQDFNDEQTCHQNEDGSSSEHEQTDYDNHKGTKGASHRDTEVDKDGNRKVHYEEVWEENGKCEMVIIDETYDKNNVLLSHTEKRMPCSKYNLEVSMEGTADLGDFTVVYGPNSATIPLGLQDGVYTGSYQGMFTATMSGVCSGNATYPVTFDVTAREDEFQDLDFSVKASIGIVGAGQCDDAAGSVNRPPTTGILTFTLPAKDGASKVYDSGGVVKTSFTLKNR